jgi:hypothetical protein
MGFEFVGFIELVELVDDGRFRIPGLPNVEGRMSN